MSNEVFANGNEIACKSGDGKVIAAFPDVCLSPPSPPAGPVPVPYPNTSFSKDMKKGSKTVKIDGKEVMLKDKSFYKTSPLGDEAATKSLGAGVVSHVITGKTYFVAWSMDVKFEGKNVDRHIDLTTSNHASPMANASVPNPNSEALEWGKLEDEEDECACCGAKPKHSNGDVVDMDTWYTTDNLGNSRPDLKIEYHKVMTRVANRKLDGCICNGRVVPEPPCNVFRNKTTQQERDAIKAKWNKASRKGDGPGTVRNSIGARSGEKVNHLVPKSAGACPDNPGNLQAHERLCSICKAIDDDFGKLQTEASKPSLVEGPGFFLIR
jgi:Toxin PAAR-like domain